MIGLQEEMAGDEGGDGWYVFRYINPAGVGIHAVAFETSEGIAVRAKSHKSIDINFANKLIDEWINKEFFDEEDMGDSSGESVKRYGG